MSRDEKEYVLQWFEKADHDLMAAHKKLEIPPIVLDVACFLCQQSVEKYLKAYLIYKGKIIEKTHNLYKLLESCTEFDNAFENIDIKDLNDFAVDIRYPDDAKMPGTEETKEYVQMAEDIKALVRKKIVFDV